MKSVTEVEFDKFLKEYPKKLTRDYNQIYEPPLISFNDFSLGDYPESVVAYCNRDGDFRIKDDVNNK